jgi:hypothetical protein
VGYLTAGAKTLAVVIWSGTMIPSDERMEFDMINAMGGNRTFAAAANLIGQLEESGRSGLRPSFFDMQTQLTAAVSPNLTSISW